MSTPQALVHQALQTHRALLVDWVVDLMYEKHPELQSSFGPHGRTSCSEDVSYHVDFLIAAIIGESADPFVEYCRWLNNVLLNRGVKTNHLVESLRWMQEFLEVHLNENEAAFCRGYIAAGCAALTDTGNIPTRPSYFNHLPAPLAGLETFTDALVNGDSTIAQTTTAQLLEQGLDPIDINTRLIQPAMYEVGIRWETNRITVAQEHLATAMAQTLMARAISKVEYAPRKHRRGLFACIPGNFHSLGLRMVSDAFELAGWEVQYLGADVPFQSLLAQTDAWKPDLLGLSMSTLNQLPVMKFCLNELRRELGADCPALMAGGLAMNQAPDLKGGLGADIWAANARQAAEEHT